MSPLVWFYLWGAVAFATTDHFAGRIAGSKPRPLATLALAIIWPVSFATAMLLSAVIIGRYRAKGGDL